MISFIDSLMKIVIIFKSQKKRKYMFPKSFIKLTVNGPFLSALPLGTELEVHYESRCNRVICQAAELLGLKLGPAAPTDSPPLAWCESKFQPYFDDKTTAEELLSHCVQMAAEDGLRSWSDDPCKINILVLNDYLSTHYKHMTWSKLMSCSNLEVKISHVDLEKAKRQVSQVEWESVIVVGEYDTLVRVVSHCGKTGQLYCITHYNNNGSPKYSQTLRPISVCQTESGKLALLKKVKLQDKVRVYKIESLEGLSGLRSFVEEEKKNNVIIVVTENLTPRQVLPILAKEAYAYRIRTVFIQDRDAPQFSLSTPFYSSQLSLGLSVNILSGGVWGSLRSSSLNLSPCDLNPNNLITSSNKNLSITSVGLNTTFFTFHRQMVTEESELKYLDYCGVLKGQHVMGVAYFEPESNSLRPDPILEWPVPSNWTAEDAATVPVLYTMAYYCVIVRARVKKGEFVLVHAAMSPIGQAIVAVVLQAGAKVIASVLDEGEVQPLLEHFPTIKITQVFVLGMEDIKVAIRKRTEKKDIQVIISCLGGNDFFTTLNLSGHNSRIFILAVIRTEDREIIGLFNFMKNRTVFGISLDGIKMCCEESKMDLRKILQNGIDQGIVKPLNRKMFCLHKLTNAISNLQTNVTEKTVLILKYENQILPLNGYSQSSEDSLHIVAGRNVDLKFQLIEWLISHGARRVIFLNDEACKGTHYLWRINCMTHRSKCSTVMASSSCLNTVESAQQILIETLHMGSVSSIFCVCMDENSNKMKNLDSASREILPRLQQFVSLLGSGTAVCDSRASSGLPACSIQSERSLKSATKILPYLFSLITETQKETKFFSVSDHSGTTKSQEETDCFAYLPNTVEELAAYGDCVESRPRFVEEVTRSPRYAVVKYYLLPVFMIPGLGQSSVEPLLRQLMHPAFCCRLSADLVSVEDLAELLVQKIVQIQTRGPYNIVGESWGGALALTVGRLLEALGSQVNLILIQGIPTTAQSRLRALCRKYDADLATCILNVALNVQAKEVSQVSWNERLEQLLPTLEPGVREPVSRAVTSLSNQLKSFLQFRPFSRLYKGDITLIQNKNEPLHDYDNLSQFCEKSPKIVTIDEDSLSQLLISSTTVTAINEHMNTWRTRETPSIV